MAPLTGALGGLCVADRFVCCSVPLLTGDFQVGEGCDSTSIVGFHCLSTPPEAANRLGLLLLLLKSLLSGCRGPVCPSSPQLSGSLEILGDCFLASLREAPRWSPQEEREAQHRSARPWSPPGPVVTRGSPAWPRLVPWTAEWHLEEALVLWWF